MPNMLIQNGFKPVIFFSDSVSSLEPPRMLCTDLAPEAEQSGRKSTGSIGGRADSNCRALDSATFVSITTKGDGTKAPPLCKQI